MFLTIQNNGWGQKKDALIGTTNVTRCCDFRLLRHCVVCYEHDDEHVRCVQSGARGAAGALLELHEGLYLKLESSACCFCANGLLLSDK